MPRHHSAMPSGFRKRQLVCWYFNGRVSQLRLEVPLASRSPAIGVEGSVRPRSGWIVGHSETEQTVFAPMGIRRVRRRRPQQFGGVSEKATWGPWRGAFTGTSTWNTHCSGSRFGGSERTASAANRTEIAANTTSVQASDTIDSRPVSDLASADFGTISPYPTVVAVTNEKYMNVGRAGLAGSPANESVPASRQTAAKSVEKTVTIAK